MDTLSYKTKSANAATVDQKWYVVDAEGEVVGRLATRIASVLRGKNKPDFTPHVDTGDKVRCTGSKLDDKEYQRYTGYPGGLKRRTAKEMLEKRPEMVLELAVKGMLPKTKLGRAMIKKLFLYKDATHPHAAQKPEPFKF